MREAGARGQFGHQRFKVANLSMNSRPDRLGGTFWSWAHIDQSQQTRWTAVMWQLPPSRGSEAYIEDPALGPAFAPEESLPALLCQPRPLELRSAFTTGSENPLLTGAARASGPGLPGLVAWVVSLLVSHVCRSQAQECPTPVRYSPWNLVEDRTDRGHD